MPHDGLLRIVEHAPQIGAERYPELSDRAVRFAMSASELVLSWLAYSPNNPGYHASDTYRLPKQWVIDHSPDIQNEVARRITQINISQTEDDTKRLQELFDPDAIQPRSRDYEGKLVPLPREFTAYDIAYAGVRDICELRPEPYMTAEAVHTDSIRAIGATLMRVWHFSELAQAHPDVMTQSRFDSFHGIFRQNTLTLVRQATSYAQQPAQPAYAADLVA